MLHRGIVSRARLSSADIGENKSSQCRRLSWGVERIGGDSASSMNSKRTRGRHAKTIIIEDIHYTVAIVFNSATATHSPRCTGSTEEATP